MALPEGLSLEHHRDLAGRGRTPIVWHTGLKNILKGVWGGRGQYVASG